MVSAKTKAKPFLKWAGGKGQLLFDIVKLLPMELRSGQIHRYVEPFVGAGAVFWEIAQMDLIEEFVISDINPELYIAYKTIQKQVHSLIDILVKIRTDYHSLSSQEQSSYYYQMRDNYNQSRSLIDFSNFNENWIERTAQLIFMNHTCFNGLFRINSKLQFNVPFGRYVNPSIFDENNLQEISKILQKTQILCGDFSLCKDLIDNQTFVYFDPPYRPISKTASFSSYFKNDFNDDEQKRLGDFYRLLDAKGAKLMLSNSDPQNNVENDYFFQEIYQGYHINRVQAVRAINSKGAKRGAISELIITNY